MCDSKNVDEFKSAIDTNINRATSNPQDKVARGQLVTSGQFVTTGQFVTMVIKALDGSIMHKVEDCYSGYMDYALHKGIIEGYDIGNKDYPIERRAAARITHKALLIEVGERDEDEWSAANTLQDLYTCRTCVIHIAQMYVKGIMLSRNNNIFDVKGRVSYSEALSIVERMIAREKRIPQTEDRIIPYRKLTPDEAWELASKDNKAMIIDVRSNEEYMTGHIEGSICIPLKDMSNNPFSVCENRDIPIILYCIKGYKSAMAAQILLDAGYSKVYTIPGIEEYKYNLCN